MYSLATLQAHACATTHTRMVQRIALNDHIGIELSGQMVPATGIELVTY